jgi:hypothetical protein
MMPGHMQETPAIVGAGQLIEEPIRFQTGISAMALDPVADGARQRGALQLRFDDDVLRSFSNQPLGRDWIIFIGENHDWDAAGAALHHLECIE